MDAASKPAAKAVVRKSLGICMITLLHSPFNDERSEFRPCS
jgi:hypothetical protein